MTEKSTLDVAYEILENKNELEFEQLWKQVIEVQKYDQDDQQRLMSRFYTNLMLDGRFVNLGDNTWGLRINNTYDKVHIDIEDVYTDVNGDSDDPEEKKDIKEEAGELADDVDTKDEEEEE